MKQSRSRLGRIARIVTLGAFALALTPSLPASAQEREIYDYPAANMYPADVAEAGFENYGLVMGWYATPEDMMVVAEDSLGEAGRQDIIDSGIQASYYTTLHPIAEPKDGDLYGVSIDSMVAQFVDAEHASDNLFTIVTALTDEFDRVDGVTPVGDESLYISYEFEAGEVGPQVEHTYELGVRVGDVVGTVSLRGLGEGVEVDLDQVEAMAQILEAKLLGLVNGDLVGTAKAPNLSQIMPDYFRTDLCVCRIQYMMYGGEGMPMSYRADEMNARQALAEEYNAQAQFYALVKPHTAIDEQNDSSMRVRVTRFNRADDAADYIADSPEWMQDFPEQMRPFANVETAIEYGEVDGYESSIMLSYETEGDQTGALMEGHLLLVQNGRYVFEISLDGQEAPEVDVLLDVVDQLEGCLEEGCATTTEVPESVMDYFSTQADIAAEQ